MTVPCRPARRDPVTDELFGVRVPDPYRWLEDVDAPETVAWVEAQAALVRRRGPELLPVLLAHSPAHDARPVCPPITRRPAAISRRRVGHGPGSLDKSLDERADIYAFLVSALGITVGGHP